MKIYVDRIPTEGIVDSQVYDPTVMDMDREDVFLRKPFHLKARINRFNHDLVVRGDIEVPMTCICARCLEEFEISVKAQLVLSYAVEGQDMVDITDDVRQEAILTYPMVPHCKSGCQGLCSGCGANLNLEHDHRCSVART